MTAHPQQPILHPHPGQAAQYYYQSSKEYKPTSAYRFRKFLFLSLGIMVVLNLNILSNRILEIDQLASPFILLACMLGVAYSKVSRVNGVPIAARLFLAALLFVLGVGVVIGLTRGFHKIGLVGSMLLKDLATIIVFYAAVLLSRSMQKLGGTYAEKQVLNICYWLSLIATAAVFLPYIFPQWHNLIRGEINETRMSGVYGNPNTTSMAVLSFMIFGLAKTAHDKKMIHLIVAMAIGGTAILATGSRSGILGIFLIVAPLGAVLFGFKHVFRIVLTIGIMGTLSYATYLGIVQKAQGNNHHSRRWEQTLSLYEDGLTDENTSGRFTLGKIAIEMFQKKPIVGHGIGGSRPMLPISSYGPHNYYFVVLVETGLLGFVPFMFFWVFVGIKAFDPRIDNWNRVLTLGLFLVISTSGLASHTIFTERNQVFLLGAALGMTRNRY